MPTQWAAAAGVQWRAVRDALCLCQTHLRRPQERAGAVHAGAEPKDYEQALVDYAKAIELNPQYAIAYYNRGTIYAELKNHEQALADYTEAIELNPQYATAYYNRALTYLELEEYEQTLADYTEAIELSPQRARYYSHRAVALYRLGRHDGAQCDFDQTQSLEVDNSVFIDLATRSTLAGEPAEAIAYLRRAFELDPQDTWDSIEDDQDFDVMRDTAEFQGLLKEFGR